MTTIKKGLALRHDGKRLEVTAVERYGVVHSFNESIMFASVRMTGGRLRQRAYKVRRDSASAERLRKVLKRFGYRSRKKETYYYYPAEAVADDGTVYLIETFMGQLTRIGRGRSIGLSISHK